MFSVRLVAKLVLGTLADRKQPRNNAVPNFRIPSDDDWARCPHRKGKRATIGRLNGV
jgi:hypothetical protein